MGVAAARPHPKCGLVAPRAPLLKFLEITSGFAIADIFMTSPLISMLSWSPTFLVFKTVESNNIQHDYLLFLVNLTS